MSELRIVRDLLNELNKNVEYCHWKSNQHFSKALQGIDDLDILINRNNTNELLIILSKLNFKHFYTPAARTYVGIEDWMGFDEDTGKIIHLHLHYNLVVGEKHLKGFHLPFEFDILSNRVYNEEYGVYFSSFYDELLMLLLRVSIKKRKRDFFKKKYIDDVTYEEFYWLKENCSDFVDKVNSNKLFTDRLKRNLVLTFEKNLSKIQISKLNKIIYSDLSCYSQGCKLSNTMRRNVREVIRINLELKKRFLGSKYTLLRRRSAKGGIIIAFLGSDGAGKSSTIHEIELWMKKFMDVRYFYLGSGDGKSSILRSPLKFFQNFACKMNIIKKTNNFNETDSKEGLDVPLKSYVSFVRKIWIYTLSNERIKKIKILNRCKLRGYAVVVDRYPQSEFDGLCDGPKLRNQKGYISRVEEKSFSYANLCMPDLVLKFIVSPKVAAKRKPGEIDEKISSYLTERVKEINFNDSTKSVMIDADDKHENVILAVKRKIWKEL